LEGAISSFSSSDGTSYANENRNNKKRRKKGIQSGEKKEKEGHIKWKQGRIKKGIKTER
jgi:hypothetical protein